MNYKRINNFKEAFEIKINLLVTGINVDLDDTKISFKKKVDALYSHTPYNYDKIPQEIILYHDENTKLPIVCNIRFNKKSPYRVFLKDNILLLKYEDNLYIIEPTRIGNLYDYQFSESIQILGVNLAGIVLSNYCHFVHDNKKCRFCEIDSNCFNVKAKSRVEILKHFKKIKTKKDIKYLSITSGNFNKDYDKMLVFFIDFIKEIKFINKDIKILLSLMPPSDDELLIKLKNVGCDMVAFNIEMLERKRFEKMVPGKNLLGYDLYVEKLKKAKSIFGAGNVYSNFVYGVQSLIKNRGDTFNGKEENDISLKGVKFLLKNGIIPLYTVYHTNGTNEIGDININIEKLINFSLDYGRLVLKSNLVDKDKKGVLFDLGSISNHVYNDAYILNKYYL
ncbi:radical SAM protein [archaeon]|nr:radical SAM protein [archaeon]MCK9439384.1 radical SAM protein [Patescibacteria group bacterium]MDD3919424.1 radical SAM protein [Candidatus Paceibacterota bacterium]